MSLSPGTTATPVPAPIEIPGRCYRCGQTTRSPDVGLCDECNPTGIAGPTATQVHGLILGAVGAALLLMAVSAKLLTSGTGPFPATVVGQAAFQDGTTEVAMRITNEGQTSARPTCTLTRGPDDAGVEFLADRIEAGASVVITRRVAALPPGSSEGPVQVSCQ